MALQTLTLKVSAEMYRRLQRCAEQAHRSIEDEVLDLVAFAMPVDDELPTSLLEALAPLPTLDDAALWRVARSRLPIDVSVELEDLHLKRQREGLTDAEAERAAELVRQYDRTMLLRAESALLLKQRGQEVPEAALRV